MPGIPAFVYLPGTQTLATVYTDRTKAHTKSNPLTTDTEGNLTILAEPGNYDLNCNGETLGIIIYGDPSDGIVGPERSRSTLERSRGHQ
jgi:hypothetical protein